MKKRVVSWLLVVLMLTSLLPTSVLAEMVDAAANTAVEQPLAEDVTVPETPETPEVPEIPETPETPEAPEAPEVPEETENTEDTENTDGAEQETGPQSAVQSANIAVQEISGTGEVGDPYLITSSDDFAKMKQKGYAKLTNNITVTTPYSSTYMGTFDGDGHTITFNYVGTSNENVGVFAKTGSGAVIKNVEVIADVKSSAFGLSYGIGGLVGAVQGDTELLNCGVSGSVESTTTKTGSSNVAKVGGLVGLVVQKLTLKGCYSAASITSKSKESSSAAGGLVGGVGSSARIIDATNCYSVGTVTAQSCAGGFIGYLYSGSSAAHTYTNCYAAATVAGGSSKAYGFAYVSNGAYATFKNCYFDSTLNEKANNGTIIGTITGKTTAAMKTEEFVAELNKDAEKGKEPYLKDTSGGYPILSWQKIDTTTPHTVTFKITPAEGSVLKWGESEYKDAANGVYTIEGVTYGSYPYTVTNKKDDYADTTGTVSVKNKDVTETVTLKPNTYDLTFITDPAGATVTVKDSTGSEVKPVSGVYKVPNGTYSYTVGGVFGYQDKSGEVTIDKANKAEEVTLDKAPFVTVTFVYNGDVEHPKITVKQGYTTMPAEEGGSYKLYVGYTYSYEFSSDNYVDQKGTLDLTKEAGGTTKSVPIPMSTKPTKDSNGYYQIASADHLAWFRDQVNAGKSGSWNAKLTADITLKGTWTPIGKSGYYTTYKGTFDGHGHTISGLNVSASSANQGLFGYINGATVKNLTVKGSVTGGESTGGIVGYMSSGTVSQCINEATVTGANKTGGVVGYLSYGTVTQCVNKASVTGNNSVGGIVGEAASASKVENCYNRGNIKAAVSKAGGVIGYLNATSSSYANEVSNCYTIGTVSGSSSAAVVGAIYKDWRGNCYSTITNCYYTKGSDTNGTSATDDQLKKLENPVSLGSNFHVDVQDAAGEYINDGYPILKCQLPHYTVTLTVNAPDADVTVDGEALTGGVTAGQTTTYTAELSYGDHRYTASAFGYEDKTDSFTVTAVSSFGIELPEKAKRTITFNVTPADAEATVTVTWKGSTIAAASGTTYKLPDGDYSYTVAAKSYGQETGELKVDAASDNTTIDVELTFQIPKTNADGAYLIGSRAELAWFRDQINAGESCSAVLTADIDLKNQTWMPIGKDSAPFTGTFDGAKHTVSGLKVSARYAGLFGIIENAEIKNVIVQGTVTATGSDSYAAGIAAAAKGSSNSITDCGNEAAVSSDNYAAGILASNHSNSTTTTITGSYNSGSVSGKNRSAGILAFDNGKADISDCYNVGTITGSSYAGGIRAYNNSMAGAITNCYNAGAVKGSNDSQTGAIVPGSTNKLINCYYLDTGKDSNTSATALDLLGMKTLDLGDAFEHVTGQNSGMPVLKWQGLPAKEVPAVLLDADDVEFERTKVQLTSASDVEDEESATLATGKLKWEPYNNAEGYVVSLWRQEVQEVPAKVEDITNFLYWSDEEAGEYLTAEQLEHYKTLKHSAVGTDAAAAHPRAAYLQQVFKDKNLTLPATTQLVIRNVKNVQTGTETKYDFTNDFLTLDEGVYYAAVTPVINGDFVLPSAETVENEYVGWQLPYDRMKAVENLHWDGGKLCWDAKTCMTDDQMYSVVLYFKEGEDEEYTFLRMFELSGSISSVNLGNTFAVGKSYVAVVVAHSDEDMLVRYGLTDSLPATSPVYLGNTEQEIPDDEHGEGWIPIASAADWIEIANTPDELVVPGDQSSGNKRDVEWSKKYYLTKDIDFSTLTAAEQTRTKSIGDVNHQFNGTLDGNGYKITGLTLSNNDSGLFSYVGRDGLIHDVVIDSANVLFSDNAAVLVCNNYGLVDNCAVLNTNITADTGAVLGGMVSRNYGYIRNSYVQGGSLTSNSNSSVGHAGFVGANETGGRIENCWTSMTVSTQSEHAGGFVGLGYGGTIRNCFALGDVSARGYSGGFIGRYVYNGNVTENCYAAGVVTVTGTEGNGFNGGNQSWSSFQYEQKQGTKNCYYNSATQSSHDYGAEGKSLSDMKTDSFRSLLDQDNGVWAQSADKNNGLPYLTNVAVPKTATTEQITVQLAIASYNKSTYAFEQMGKTISVTMDSTGNTRVVDLLDAAQAQDLLTYSYATTSTFGRFIHTINGRSVDAPDGWMFTINDALSNVSASLAAVKDGDKVLWFEGTTENLFQGPTWDELSASRLTWEAISTVDDLKKLAAATDAETLAKNYKLADDLDLTGVKFSGIGSSGNPFTGRFDGQGHTISNVTVSNNGGTGVGFFNAIKGATIKNLNLKGVVITGGTHVGGLVGEAQVKLDRSAPAESVANLIGSCTVTGTVSGSVSVGGLVGLNGGEYDEKTSFSIASAVNNCRADVTVTGVGTGSDANNKLGGLVGDNAGAVTASSASGNVAGAKMVGGLTGSNSGSIYDSHATGAVTGTSSVGGFVGSSTDGTVKRCYSTGSVSGENYIGSFAGSISNVDTAVGAGQVTVTGSSGEGYVGGFAGNLGGTLTGVANQITVKNVYGNCTTADPEKPLNAVGNTSKFTTDSAKEALADMQLTTRNAVNEKLYALFGVYLPGVGGELDRFTDTVIPYGAAKDTVFKLYIGTLENIQITSVTVETNDYISASKDGTVKLLQAHQKADGAVVKVTVTLVSEGCTVSKTVTVTLLQQTEALMDSIAARLTETKDGWTAMDMALYQSLGNKSYKLTDAARQNIIDLLIAEANTTAAIASDRSRIEIVLRALGVDSTRIYPVNSNTPISNAAKLRAADMSAVLYYTAPYVLLANAQGNVKLSAAQINTLLTTLENAVRDDGMLGGEYNGMPYTDADSTGVALAALACYADNSRAKTLLTTLTNGLKAHVASAGYYSNANTDAMVILGLIAVGEDPCEIICANGLSVVDDMLRYALTDGSGFGYADNTALNSLATDQGFRALIALAKFQKTNKAFNAFDFSDTAVKATHAVGTGEGETPKEPEETEEKLTVAVTISTPGGIWFSGSVKLNKGSTVYHALNAALRDGNITAVGAANGYVISMTKDGVTYGEFTSGKNSGWLYKVNGVLPNIPLTQYGIKNGDSVLWYYTLDWTKDPDAGKMADEEVTAADVIKLIDAIGTVNKNSGNAIAAARTAYNKLSAAEKALVTNYDKLLAAEAVYAELLKAQQEGTQIGTVTGWQKQYQDALDAVKTDQLAFGSEWLVIALARSGRPVPDSYYDSVVKAVQDAKGQLSDKKSTEYSRTILALTAIGKDPSDVGGYDLLAKLADMDDVTYQGLNGAVFALLALDSNKYDVPAVAAGGNQTTRDGLVAYLLEQQLTDGGWALSGSSADPDMTAMVLQALAPYRTENAAVQTAVDKAIQTLSQLQQADGGYSSWGTLNSESCAQVLIALATLGIDPVKDSRFAKNGLTLLDALLAYVLDNGFRHTMDGAVDAMATEQALCALTAYARLLDGKTALYDMTDVLGGQTADTPNGDETPNGQPGQGVPVVVWIALGAVAVGGGAALVITRRRREK